MNFKCLMPLYEKQVPSSYTYKFTVFTPVFNCENSIEKVHDSLLNQTYKNFEWLVINDGSTDRSHDVITEIIEISPLNINYVNNIENKHKMSCFIQSIELARGEFLLPLDGDDECDPNALEVFNNEYEKIPEELKSTVAAVTVHCRDQYGNHIGELFPQDPFYCNTFEARITKQISGEKWGFTKTDVLKGILVSPDILGKGYVPESIIWNTVARNDFLTKCVNRILRVYNVGVEGSIMNTPMSSRSAFGIVLNVMSEINWFFNKNFPRAPIYFFKKLYILLRTSTYLDYPLRVYLRSIDSYIIKLCVLVLWPFRKLMK
ncbi:glycosyltransferase family 2 protein [Gelidibacter pelagius]|uniref:Glycosyltransferase family 2 protein n=1 Tax=Gelidibacter pelagius TaxID=2819985 RepID=A0ABS3SQC9_9FLAO|nr:glycosyltransferase family 2 protein [Gelidibacter pelagius]MBO3097901.1 glycosyltransferase family 2 protein [Gelidibacter pelagius]